MGARSDLEKWLHTRSGHQLERIRDRYGMRRFAREHMPQVAYLMMQDYSVLAALDECNLPETEVLSTIVWLAEQHHGAVSGQPYQDNGDPAYRAVPRGELLALLAGDDPETRAKAERVLDDLAEIALILPSRPRKLVVANALHRALSGVVHLGDSANRLMSNFYEAPEVHRIAEALGFKREPRRANAQANVLSVLTDPGRLRALIDAAPPDAIELLQKVLEHGGLLGTHAIRHGGGPSGKFVVGPAGDPMTDWLVARGILLPAGVPERATISIEVFRALGRTVRASFTPDPPAAVAAPPDVPVEDHAQAAASAAAAQIERVLAACEAQPLTIRKNGGVAVRETKRLAKELGLEADVARFWIDLCFAADLLNGLGSPAVRTRSGRGRDARYSLVPTASYDRWLTLAPAGRLVAIFTAWALVPRVYTWWPDEEETRVALTGGSDDRAVGLRYALLEALAVRPGVDLDDLLAAAGWYRPLHISPHHDAARARATLREAELLGVVAAGRLTSIGHAVLALLRQVGVNAYPGYGGPSSLPSAPELEDALAALMPPPQTRARFQADLTAVAAGAPTAELAALLSAVADRESEGHAVVWRFSPRSVRRALDTGRDAATIIEELASVAAGSLPQPLEYLIKDAARTHGRMRVVRSACCVRSDDDALVAEMAAERRLSALELRRIAPTVLVSVKPPEETLRALRTAGYTPVLEAETGDTVVEKKERPRARPRFKS